MAITSLVPAGNVIFTDESGQTYILYHGILSASPYYPGNAGYTARPGFIDAIDWVNGWPVARGGFVLPMLPRPGRFLLRNQVAPTLM